MIEIGTYDGEPCNRNGCNGSIVELEDEASKCSRCWPPCYRTYLSCPICGWDDRKDLICK
jgi:hypothetical protein